MILEEELCSLAPSEVTPLPPPRCFRPQFASHLANARHPGHDALVVAFPRNLAEEEVDLVVVWVEGVGNGMGGYEPGLWGEKKTRGTKSQRCLH